MNEFDLIAFIVYILRHKKELESYLKYQCIQNNKSRLMATTFKNIEGSGEKVIISNKIHCCMVNDIAF